jgi:cytochrome c551/c552
MYSLSQRRFKVNGPSLQDIQNIQREKRKYDIILKGESEAIVDPEQYEVMAANLAYKNVY